MAIMVSVVMIVVGWNSGGDDGDSDGNGMVMVMVTIVAV